MNDEKDQISTVQPPAADKPGQRQDPPAYEARLPLFRTGSRVSYKGEICTVNHVLVSRGQLLVSLNEHQRPVDADDLLVAPTSLVFKRNRPPSS